MKLQLILLFSLFILINGMAKAQNLRCPQVVNCTSLQGDCIELDLDNLSNTNYNDVNKSILGLNPGHSFYYLVTTGSTNCSDCNGDGKYQCLDQNVVSNLSALKPGSLRFPAGTEANFYHFGAALGTNNCPNSTIGYGHIASELNDHIFLGFDLNVNDYYDIYFDAFENPSTTVLERNFIHDFVDFVYELDSDHATDPDIEITYVLNVLGHFRTDALRNDIPSDNDIDIAENQNLYDENVRAIQFLLDEGINVTTIEIGNELNYEQTNSTIVVSKQPKNKQDDYMSIAEYYINSLSSHFSENFDYVIPTQNDEEAWTDRVTNLVGDESDRGMAMHYYYTNTNTTDAEDVRDEFYDLINENGDLINLWDDIIQDDDDNKRSHVYFTEFNFANSSGFTTNSFDHSFLHGAFVMEMMFMLLYNEVLAADEIRMANLHTFIAGSASQAHLSIFLEDASNDYLKSAGAFAYELMEPLTQDDMRVYDDDIFTTFNNLQPEEIALKLFVKVPHPNIATYYVYFVNKTNGPVDFNLRKSFPCGGIFSYDLQDVHYISVADPSTPTPDDMKTKLKEEDGISITVEALPTNSAFYEIPAYSMGYFEVVRNCIYCKSTIITNTEIGIVEESKVMDALPFDVFPNPASTYVSIKFSNDEEKEIEFSLDLFNSQGKRIRHFAKENLAAQSSVVFDYDIDDIPSGIYFFKYSTDASHYVLPLVID